MKGKKLLFGFSVVVVFILASQFTNATQITLPEATIDNETPLRCIDQFRYRYLNLTANHEWLFNMSQICDNQCNCTTDSDQLQIRDRIQERIQEFIQDCDNALMQMVLNNYRHNE